MDEENSESRQTSKYNTASLINARLHQSWLKFTLCIESGRFNQSDLILNSLWIELAGDLEDDEYNSTKDKSDEINNRLFSYGLLRDGDNLKGFNSLEKQDVSNRTKQYKILIEKALFLKRLEKRLGKGTAWNDDQEDAWD